VSRVVGHLAPVGAELAIDGLLDCRAGLHAPRSDHAETGRRQYRETERHQTTLRAQVARVSASNVEASSE
jgi:hypothetical protein